VQYKSSGQPLDNSEIIGAWSALSMAQIEYVLLLC